ncbi:hypothetical protein DICVIV_01379 [Dictyocaulus viviparus]|uniref:Uncharacterized protein n=1 Tax=Dictyocaulus viviparus TaxID=29172 RepID=A0A0D8Y875_DICVI|nr:hypothetical protein DICVIV_01379 [Dictyocaulus viviparus]
MYSTVYVILFLIDNVYGQKYGSDEPLVVPLSGTLAQFPALITADNFPLFPFTDQFSTGVEINPANKVSVAGDLNIPVPGWGNFDVDGNIYFGHINVDAKAGYQIRPTNKLGIKPETLALLGQNPEFRLARKQAKELVVGRIPYGYEPIKCKPPYCNPFVHHAGAAVEVEQGDDWFFIGGIDFPLPIGPLGSGVRFPLSGAVEAGTSPYAYAHGNAFNPVSPFDLKAINDEDITQTIGLGIDSICTDLISILSQANILPSIYIFHAFSTNNVLSFSVSFFLLLFSKRKLLLMSLDIQE